ESYDNVWCSVGVHPHEAASEATDAARLIPPTRHPKVIGIGETGLDYYYDRSPRPAQQANFRAHLQAARDSGLPVIVHARDADDDTGKILEDAAGEGPLAGVLHCFTASLTLARRAIDIGFYVSISGIITFKNAEDLRETVRVLPLDRLLVETDSPFLAPVPMRGHLCEPAYLTPTAAQGPNLHHAP